MSLQLSNKQSVGDVWIAGPAGPKESSTGEVQQLQKFCRRNCWASAAPSKSKRQLPAECRVQCRTRGSNHLPSREAPAWTATGQPGMPLRSRYALGWAVNRVRAVPVWCDLDIVCQWSVVQWRSAQTATRAVECPANRTAHKVSH